MPLTGHIAVDLGAESGRVVLGAIRGDGRLWMHEVHRFTHRSIPTPTGLCWDLTGLWREILNGLQKVPAIARSEEITPVSIGVDTWAVDWTLVSERDSLLGLPRCYRDRAFPPVFERMTRGESASRIYHATGIQHLPFNTLYQVAAEFEREPDRFKAARLMFMPDLFHWLLSGQVTCELTNASTSQMLDTRTGQWATELLSEVGLPSSMLIEPINPTTTIGTIRAEVAETTGLTLDVRVIAPPTHDTAAAIAAVPAVEGSRWAYLSSGTWSLLGAELTKPLITDASARANFTNELGIAGTARFLKNIAGLWLVQECRHQWQREGQTFDYAQLTELAAGALPLRTLVPANDPSLLAPRDMVASIRELAQRCGQPVPESPGEIVRCCLESLALEYRRTLAAMSDLLAHSFDVLHVVGGGSKNALLNQLTADATGCVVRAGPAEATAIGNLLSQAIGYGSVKDLTVLRAIVRQTESPVTFEPQRSSGWNDAIDRYERLLPT